MTPWVVSYDERMMPQPKRFRPERWLEATKEERSTMGRHLEFILAEVNMC